LKKTTEFHPQSRQGGIDLLVEDLRNSREFDTSRLPHPHRQNERRLLLLPPRRSLNSSFQDFHFMKKPSCRRSAFTLIELLVVIAIIAVLAGLAFPAVNGAIEAAKKAKAKNDVVQIVTAIKAYQTEYGKLPIYNGKADYEADNDVLFNFLRPKPGLDGTQKDMNPRLISFIEIRVAKGDKDGLVGGVFMDPWGKPYKIRLDADYNNQVENFYSANAGWDPVETSVIVASSGKDRAGLSGDKNAGAAKDDIISWQ
jgi:prepilin-type N-terminal cleavage/methylation domain-containing protein